MMSLLCPHNMTHSRKCSPVCLTVCQVSNADGNMKVTMVAEKNPFSQDALQSSECFILDNGANGHIYVWKGSNWSDNSSVQVTHQS